jgi:tripartite-type tricarboxylate transporter receptor subunit TctC
MTRVFACVVAAISVLLLFLNPAKAQDSFYNGKTVRIIVGASAGGGYDTYSRTIARHMGKHIPGNPTFVVDNMPGAGMLIAATMFTRWRNRMG